MNVIAISAHSIFINDFLGRIQLKFCANLRIIFKKIAHKVDLLGKKGALNSNINKVRVVITRVRYM